MVPELFLQEARPFAVGIATIVNWLANFTVGLSFPYILVISSICSCKKLMLNFLFLEISVPIWYTNLCSVMWWSVDISLSLSSGNKRKECGPNHRRAQG